MIRLGPYELVREIAVGGMAEVHLARVTGIGGFEKYVALKTIHPQYAADSMFVDLLVNEAKIAVQLVHPNIAQTFDLGRVGNTYYMSMEFIDGVDVWRLLVGAERRKMPLPIEACVSIIHDVAAALDHAHSRTDASGRELHVVHRDVSPQNVMMTWDGLVKLVDFGIAKATGSVRHTRVGGITGKRQYLSPEQASGRELDGRSDIFSAGLVLHEMLTGRPVYIDGEFAKLVELARAAEIAPPSRLRPGIPPQLDRIVMRALARDPAQRYQRGAELAKDLREVLRARAPRFGPGSLAELIERVVGRPPPLTASLEETTIDELSVRRLGSAELAQAGDHLFDDNSVLAAPSEARVDTNPSAENPFENRGVTKPGIGTSPPVRAGFERFAVHERLGWSLLATVDRATLHARGGDREVALKRLSAQLADDTAFAERFFEEMARVARLTHGNIAEVIEYGCIDRVHFVAAELMRGIPLANVAARAMPAPNTVVTGIVAQLCDALVAIHPRTAHGNVTPANAIITADGTVKLTDLGVAKALWGVAPHAIAKLGYMAPEMAMNGLTDERSDVFGVGVIAWELIAGRRLFDGQTVRDLLQQLRSLVVEPPSRHNPACDEALERAVMRALARHDQRTTTAAELRAQLPAAAVDRAAIAAWTR